jgi:RNA recognition motif-containing protein
MSINQTETAVAASRSSRLFVKNLPPNITEADFRKHFSAQGREVTDVKLIPHRRIGFVGYKSHEHAARAVKYFNRSFIRMSKISVDIAKPVRRLFAPRYPILDADMPLQDWGPYYQRTSCRFSGEW